MRENGRAWAIDMTGYSSEEGLVEIFDTRQPGRSQSFLNVYYSVKVEGRRISVICAQSRVFE